MNATNDNVVVPCERDTRTLTEAELEQVASGTPSIPIPRPRSLPGLAGNPLRIAAACPCQHSAAPVSQGRPVVHILP
jgi:hypothetical protein